VNGIPLVVFELKTVGNEQASTKSAWNQLQTYKAEIPELFRYNAVLVVSDGVEAVAGSLTAGFEHFAPWRTIDGTDESAAGLPALEVLARGMMDRSRLLTLMRDHIVFSDERVGLVKRLAKHHQYWAVERAVVSTLQAIEGDGRAGVVWHTQGSGKSFEMHCYAAKIMRHPGMGNPTVVMLTDRNDLDDQLHDEVFVPSVARGFLPEAPVKAAPGSTCGSSSSGPRAGSSSRRSRSSLPGRTTTRCRC
jgi:type I restriction enzyme, R subunit